MTSWSKLAPGLSDVQCRHIVHPWTDNCLLGVIDMFTASCVGSTGFFSLLYLYQYLSRVLKKKKKTSFIEILKIHVRSTFFAALTGTLSVASSCLLRRLLGRYYYYTMILIPATIGGCSLVLARPTKTSQDLFVNAFVNCALEFSIRQLEDMKLLRWTPNQQTAIFMVLSSLLSTLFSKIKEDKQYFWVFPPPKVDETQREKDENRKCFHKDDCLKHSFNLFAMYFTTGFLLQFVRLMLSNIKNPKLFISLIMNVKNFKMASFLGFYVLIYQAIRCFLYQKNKKYSSLDDTLAGFLAGGAFRFQPTLPIFNSVIITIVQILTEIGCNERILPQLPYSEVLFALACGLLFHAKVFYSEQCPKLMVYIMSTVTHGRSEFIHNNYTKALEKLKVK